MLFSQRSVKVGKTRPTFVNLFPVRFVLVFPPSWPEKSQLPLPISICNSNMDLNPNVRLFTRCEHRLGEHLTTLGQYSTGVFQCIECIIILFPPKRSSHFPSSSTWPSDIVCSCQLTYIGVGFDVSKVV